MLAQLSDKNRMPALLDEISQAGLSSGLKFNLFTPQPELLHDFYAELPIKISAEGTYNQLSTFISQIAEMKRIVTLHDLRIKQVVSRKTHQNAKAELLMNVTAKIYRYRKE